MVALIFSYYLLSSIMIKYILGNFCFSYCCYLEISILIRRERKLNSKNSVVIVFIDIFSDYLIFFHVNLNGK